MAGAALRHLACEHRRAAGQRRFDLIGTMPGDHHGAIGAYASSRIQNMLQ